MYGRNPEDRVKLKHLGGHDNMKLLQVDEVKPRTRRQVPRVPFSAFQRARLRIGTKLFRVSEFVHSIL